MRAHHEDLGCEACEYYTLIDVAFPHEKEPIIVERLGYCRRTGKVFWTTDEAKKTFIQCPYRTHKTSEPVDMSFHDIAREIIREIKVINSLIKSFINEKEDPIEVDPEIATELASPCISYKDFVFKVGILASLLEIDVSMLRKVLEKYGIQYKQDEKSLKLLERLLENRGYKDEAANQALNWLKGLRELRNKLPPYHKPSPPEDIIKIMKELGLRPYTNTSSDWQLNCNHLLSKFLSALKTIRERLQALISEASASKFTT